MSSLGDTLDTLVSELQTIVGAARVVTREFKDFSQRDKADLAKGVFTILSRGVQDLRTNVGNAATLGKQTVLILGQIKIGEDQPGQAIDEAEFLMFEDIQALANAALPAPVGAFFVTGFQQSQQIERPHGWIAVNCRIGP